MPRSSSQAAVHPEFDIPDAAVIGLHATGLSGTEVQLPYSNCPAKHHRPTVCQPPATHSLPHGQTPALRTNTMPHVVSFTVSSTCRRWRSPATHPQPCARGPHLGIHQVRAVELVSIIVAAIVATVAAAGAVVAPAGIRRHILPRTVTVSTGRHVISLAVPAIAIIL